MSEVVASDSKVKEIVRKIQRIEFHARRAVQNSLSGSYRSAFRGRGIEFDEYKEYTPGEDVRLIDWNVTARLGQTYVKKFREERELLTILMVDASASQSFGSAGQLKSDLSAEVAALLAFSAVWNQDKVGLILFTDKVEKWIPPKRGRAQAYRILREIFSFKPAHKETKIAEALKFLNRLNYRHALVFLLSDFISPSFVEGLRVTSARHDLTGIRFSDPSEKQLPSLGLIRLYDAETGEVFIHDSGAKHLRTKLALKNRVKEESLQNEFGKAGAELFSLDAGDPLALEKTVRFFRQKKGARQKTEVGKKSGVHFTSVDEDKKPMSWWNRLITFGKN